VGFPHNSEDGGVFSTHTGHSCFVVTKCKEQTGSLSCLSRFVL